MYLIRPGIRIIYPLPEAISSHPVGATAQCGMSNKNVCQSISGKNFNAVGQKKKQAKKKISTDT